MARPAFKLPANKFEPLWLVAAEPFDGQRQPLVGMISYCDNAARQVELLRPEMEQRFRAVTAHFPEHSRKRRDAAAILANFHDSGGGKLLEAGLQFGGEFHAAIISDISSFWTIFSENLSMRSSL
ncbi:MAG: hypothetical protein AUH11_17230 [Acidobacteria bacterium 13_2_20CM_57_17]|nr:MAG: hypothetical protein AUH11_17230 [Acidobacteria bacterium 13_2_20CM_57_17]OLB93288.1 MAG: hypothetical protein AUI02_06935 [Acidobacteria bacterium 13_2_20CM_2_57_12]